MATAEARSKNILYIGEGFGSRLGTPCVPDGSRLVADRLVPPPVADVSAHITSCRALTSANKQDVRVFSVSPTDESTVPEGRGEPRPPDRNPVFADAPAALARATSGMAMVEGAAVRAIDTILSATDTFYLIGYYSNPAKFDGRYHKIEFIIHRAGARVARARRSYVAPKSAAQPTSPAGPRRLNASLEDVVPVSGIPLHALAIPFRGATSSRPTLIVALGIDHELAGHRPKVDLDAAIVVTDMKPKVRAQSWPAMHFHADDLTRPYPPMGPQEIVDRLDIKPGHYQVRFGVRCSEDDGVGSVYVDVDVPDFAREPLSMSGIALDAPGRPEAIQASRLVGVLPIIPTTARMFGAGPLQVLARVYQGEHAPVREVSALATVLDSSGAAVFSRQFDLASDVFRADRHADLAFQVPVDGLPAGPLRLRIASSTSVDVTQREIPFAVHP
jgi:hypothetical protein